MESDYEVIFAIRTMILNLEQECIQPKENICRDKE